METALIASSHGNATVNMETGKIISIDPDLATEYQILQFDVAEFKQHGVAKDSYDTIDILDIGYWYGDAPNMQYEAPAQDWRDEVKLMRNESLKID